MIKYIDADRLKAEIEKHIKEVKDAVKRFTPNMGFFDAKLSGIYDVMAIIDSLQQEQPDIDLEKDAVQFCFDKGLNVTPYQAKTIASHFYELGKNRNDMDKIEKIRAEIDRRYNEYSAKKKTDDFAYYSGMADALDLFEQFLDTLEEEPDKSLEEEIRRYLREECSSDDEPTTEEIAHHFAEWQKAQMLKDAVEGKVYFQMGGIKRVKSDDFENPDIHLGNKVKLIIVKEN